MSLVPLPWWTSQSRISTRSQPVRVERVPGRDGDVVEQAEAHRPRALGVVAGRPVGAEAGRRRRRRAAGRRARPRRRRRAARPRTSPALTTVSGSSCAPPPRRGALDRVDVALGSARRSAPTRSAAGERTRSNPSQPRPSSSRSIATIRAGCSGCGPCRAPARTGCSRNTGAAAIGEYRTSQVTRRRRPRSPSSAPAPPGSTPRSAPPAQGARVTLVSATPLAESSSYWAQGGLAAALAADDSPERHLADTIAAGRGAVRESAARVLCDEAPARGRGPDRRSACASTPTATAGWRSGLEGGHSVRRDRPRRRRRHRPAADPPAVGAGRRGRRGSRCSSGGG